MRKQRSGTKASGVLVLPIVCACIVSVGSCSYYGADTRQEQSLSLGAEDREVVVTGGMGARLDEFLSKSAEVKGFSGAVAVMIDGIWVLQNGYGYTDEVHKIPVSPRTRFFIGSTAKGITGVAALLAQQNGLMSVQDTLDQHFPQAPGDFSDVSLHNILIHNSGISGEYSTFDHPGFESNLSPYFQNR